MFADKIQDLLLCSHEAMATSAQNLAHHAKKLAFCITRVKACCAEDIANYLVRKFNSSPPTLRRPPIMFSTQVSASATTIDTRSYEHKSKS